MRDPPSDANLQVMQFYKMHGISYCVVKYRKCKGSGEFGALILANTIWFEVIADFHFCYVYFLLFRKQKNVKSSIK